MAKKAQAHEWKPIEVDCDACGRANPLHEQPPELLVEGVAWECNHCGSKNRLGGSDRVEDWTVVECGHCHATFDPNDLDVKNGSFKCPSCGTTNRNVSVGENALSTEAGR